MRRSTDALIALLIPLLILFYLSVAPYTKVEESFNIQATYDLITYGLPSISQGSINDTSFDHFKFPGAVPRTFVGPIALATASWPFVRYVQRVDRQILVRAVLGLYNAFCILAFRNGIAKAFGRSTANWYILFQASQFHIMYYASRTLPNFFAFGLSTLALRNLLPQIQTTSSQSQQVNKSQKRALVILTIVGIIFRSEIALLLGTYTLWLLFRQQLSPKDVMYSGLLGLVIGLSITIPIDSFFWQQYPLWPELSGLIFNVFKGKSTDWGTLPIHYYFSHALPRLLLNPLIYQICIPLAVMTPALRQPALQILIPNLSFIMLYSLQPHKEWRFIVYAIPPLTAVAAMGASWIWTRRSRSLKNQILALAIAAVTALSFAASLSMLAVSSLNYPGAEALNCLHAMADGSQAYIKVHMDTLTCMTGATHFLEIPENATAPYTSTVWTYDKEEDAEKLLMPAFWEQFDYVLAERPEKVIGAWEIVHVIDGFAGIKLVRPGENLAQTPEKDVLLTKHRQGPWAFLETELYNATSLFQAFVRTWVTRGWWLQAKMEPQIKILKPRRQTPIK